MKRFKLISAVKYRNMIMRQQKDALNDTRYRYKTTLYKLRKISVENYLMRKKLKYHRNFKDVSFKQLIK